MKKKKKKQKKPLLSAAKHSKLKLPPGISVEKREKTYVIFRNGVEELGGVSFISVPTGGDQMQAYTKGTKAGNTKIVTAVAQQMFDELMRKQAKKPEHLRPRAVPRTDVPLGTQAFVGDIFPCSKCMEPTARLVLAPEFKSAEELEILSKQLELEAAISPHPIWIIGAPDCENEDGAKRLTLQIAPKKGEVFWEHPDEMNKRLVALDDSHC